MTGSCDTILTGNSPVAQFFAEYDIILLLETWFRESSEAAHNIPGFISYHQTRPSRTYIGRHHGGVSVFISQKFLGKIKVVDSCWKSGTVWIHVDKSLIGLCKQNVMLACCYFSDEQSSLYTSSFLFNNPIRKLQKDLKCHLLNDYQVIVIGDLNARVGKLIDNIETLTVQQFGSITFSQSQRDTHLPLRKSQDAMVTNSFGQELIHLLNSLSLILYNGRSDGDKKGNITCKSFAGTTDSAKLIAEHKGSVIDICFGSSELFEWLDFSVLPFLCPIDINTNHAPIQLVIKIDSEEGQQSNSKKSLDEHIQEICSSHSLCRNRARINVHNKEAYVYHMQSTVVQNALHQLSVMLHNKLIEAEQGVSMFEDLICFCKENVYRKSWKLQGLSKQKGSAAWFDDECKARQQKFGDIYNDPQSTLEDKQAARKEWQKFKKRQRLEYAQRQQMNLYHEYFGGTKGNFWQIFKSSKSLKQCPSMDVSEWSKYFATLLNTDPKNTLSPLSGHALALKHALYDKNARNKAYAVALNCPITMEEVYRMLQSTLQCGKSADLQGITAECFKYPSIKLRNGVTMFHLMPILHQLFAATFDRGIYPNSWTVNMQIPIYKGKGPRDNMDNYRGICVGSILGKMFSSILDYRLQWWCEQKQVRAPTQMGFRIGYGPLDALFSIRVLIEKARAKLSTCTGPSPRFLFCCFVDFRKAFDSCSRSELMKRCKQLGVHDKFLNCISSIYRSINMRLKVDGQLGNEFNTLLGTKQGDPLSPTLFGLFIEQLHELIEFLYPNVGPLLDNIHVPDILYADDTTLLSLGNPQELQYLLDALSVFCDLFGFEVNVSKTAIVVFHGAHTQTKQKQDFSWSFKGSNILIAEEFRYLGMLLHQSKDFDYAIQGFVKDGRNAMHALLSHCSHKKLNIPRLLLSLFDSLVKPIVSHGSQIWGPDIFLKYVHKKSVDFLHCDLEKIQLDFIRLMVGASQRAQKWILLKEFDRYPLHLNWLINAFTFWNKLASSKKEKLSHLAFCDNVQMAVNGNTQCWVHKILECARILNVKHFNSSDLCFDEVMTLRFDKGEIRKAGEEFFDKIWEGLHPDPRTAPSDDVLHSTYKYWTSTMASEACKGAEHINSYRPWELRQFYLRYKLGGHNLAIEEGRLQIDKQSLKKLNVPREKRVCHCCEAQPVEDLKHFILECPAYDSIRNNHRDFFVDSQHSLPAMFKSENVVTLCTILKAMNHRREIIRDSQGLVISKGRK